MPAKTVTFKSTLMHYTREAGKANLSGDPKRIEAAQRQLTEYEALVKESDEVR